MTWRSLGDSNPCFRRERATTVSITLCRRRWCSKSESKGEAERIIHVRAALAEAPNVSPRPGRVSCVGEPALDYFVPAEFRHSGAKARISIPLPSRRLLLRRD